MQLAGLVFYYMLGTIIMRILQQIMLEQKNTSVSFHRTIIAISDELVDVTQTKHIRLRGILNGSSLHLCMPLMNAAFSPLGEGGCSILSDDYVQHGGIHYRPAFTGCFVGMCCQI